MSLGNRGRGPIDVSGGLPSSTNMLRCGWVAALLLFAGLTSCTGEPPLQSPESDVAGATLGDSTNSTNVVGDSPVHPEFSFTFDELVLLVTDVRGIDLEAVEETPEYFLELLGRLLDLPADQLVLVDKNNVLSPDYAPGDLVAAVDYPLVVNRPDMLLSESMMPDLVAMSVAARMDGIVLDLSSGYRSYSYQDGLFNRHVNNLGLEEAKRVSAEPGKSQHQLGTTVDFGSITPAFADTAAGKWLADHGWRFGFSLSYPDGYEELTGYSYESWHFRYIGRDATKMERRFFGGIQQYLLEFLHQNRTTLEESWAPRDPR